MKKKDDKEMEINGIKYLIIRNDNDCIDVETLSEKITDYFDDYDYICGDFAYDKVRLKGFYESTNKKCKKINDIKNLDNYEKEYCCYGARLFLLKKIK